MSKRSWLVVLALAGATVFYRKRLLVMTDEDFRFALELERYNPGQLQQVVRTTRRIIDEEEFESGHFVQLTVTVEHEDSPKSAAKSTTESVPPRGHLELTAQFA